MKDFFYTISYGFPDYGPVRFLLFIIGVVLVTLWISYRGDK
jgi:hypothetical protein